MAITNQDARDFLQQARETAVCQHCGAAGDIDFHHIDRATKSFSIGAAAKSNHYTLAEVQAELAKCVPLCSSCHGHMHGIDGAEARWPIGTPQAKRKRIDLPTSLYTEIARDAAALRIPVQTLITTMLARTLEADRTRAKIPMRDRQAPAAAAKPSRKGYSAAYAAVMQDIEEQATATRKARGVRE